MVQEYFSRSQAESMLALTEENAHDHEVPSSQRSRYFVAGYVVWFWVISVGVDSKKIVALVTASVLLFATTGSASTFTYAQSRIGTVARMTCRRRRHFAYFNLLISVPPVLESRIAKTIV